MAHHMTKSSLYCRDHRKLGQELELFSIEAEMAGGGLVFWHPNGAAIRNILENFWKVSSFVPACVGLDLVFIHMTEHFIFEIAAD